MRSLIRRQPAWDASHLNHGDARPAMARASSTRSGARRAHGSLALSNRTRSSIVAAVS